MAHKRKGQLTTSGEWAKHLRGFLKRQFWKGERNAAKSMIHKEIETLSHLTYNDYDVYELNNKLISSFKLEKIDSDSDKWRTFYKSSDSNWVAFYPFNEYHGGGQQYIIRIGFNDCIKWIENNFSFEKDIRKKIEHG